MDRQNIPIIINPQPILKNNFFDSSSSILNKCKLFEANIENKPQQISSKNNQIHIK